MQFKTFRRIFDNIFGKSKSLLSYHELVELVEQGVITANLANVNGSSIDVVLGDNLLVEEKSPDGGFKKISLTSKTDSLNFRKVVIGEEGHDMLPGEFLLAQTVEFFNLPDDISAEFKLKSTAARGGLDHALAGWCDATWHGSVLTLELKNNTRYHILTLEKGMKIGQLIFYRHKPVPHHGSYKAKGQYNKTDSVTAGKGLR